MSTYKRRGAFKSRFRIKRVFRSLSVSYIIVLLIPLAITVILSVNIGSRTRETLISNIQNDLAQSCLTFQNDLEYMYTDAAGIYNDTGLQFLSGKNLFQDADKNVYDVIQMNTKLNGMYTRSSFYQEYAVILSNGAVFRSGGLIIGTEFFFENDRTYGELTYEEWEEASFGGASPSFIAMQPVTVSGVSGEYLTYNYPVLKSYKGGETVDGVLQLLISRRTLENIFNQLRNMEGASVCGYTAEGDELFAFNEADGQEELAALAVQAQGEKGSLRLERESGDALVVWQKLEEDGLFFAVSIPWKTAMSQVTKFYLISVVVLLLCLGIEICLGVYFVYQYAMPVSRVVQNIEKFMLENPLPEKEKPQEDGEGYVSEFVFLEESVGKLMDNSHYLRETLRGQEKRQKVNFLILLLEGAFEDREQLLAEGENAGIAFDRACYCAAVLWMDGWTDDAVKLLDEQNAYVLASLLMDQNMAVLILAASGEAPDWEAAYLRELRERLKEITGETPHIGIGKSCTDALMISMSFRQAKYAVKDARRGGREAADYSCLETGKKTLEEKEQQDKAHRERLTRYMEENYGDSQLGLARAAKDFSLSESYFSQFFKNVMGKPFSAWLEEVRLTKAKELLAKGDGSVEQIAGQTGYANSASFRRAFKRATGLSPAQWKGEHREDAKG